MSAKTIKVNSTDAISKEIINARVDGFTPTLAIVFLSISQDFKDIANLLDKNNIAVFGATTSGEFGRVSSGRQNHHLGDYCWVTLKEKA